MTPLEWMTLGTALVKFVARRRLGDTAETVIAGWLADQAQDGLEGQRRRQAQRQALERAFERADACFARQHDAYAQMMQAKPLRRLERLEALARVFLQRPGEADALRAGLEAQLRADWGARFDDAFYRRAAQVYQACLEDALAGEGGLLPALYAKTDRIEHNTRALLQGQEDLQAKVARLVETLAPTAEPEVPMSDDNPFWPLAGRIDDPAQVFDREREVRAALNYLRSGASVALVGERGVGKSSLLTRLMAEIPEQVGREVAFVDLQRVRDEDDFYEALADVLGLPRLQGWRLWRALTRRGQRYVLLLDEVEKMTWEGFTRDLRAELRGLAEGSDAPLKLVLAARTPLDRLFPDSETYDTSPLSGICQEVRVAPWDEATARRFLAHRLAGRAVTFTPPEVADLIARSRGHPQRLTHLAHELYEAKRAARGGGA